MELDNESPEFILTLEFHPPVHGTCNLLHTLEDAANAIIKAQTDTLTNDLEKRCQESFNDMRIWVPADDLAVEAVHHYLYKQAKISDSHNTYTITDSENMISI